jgi:hypothetical protein
VGVGLVAETALGDLGDLSALAIERLFAASTSWIVIKRSRVLPSYLLDWISDMAPQIGRRDLRRVMDGAAERWPEPPDWREVAGRLAHRAAGADGAIRKVVPFRHEVAGVASKPRVATS